MSTQNDPIEIPCDEVVSMREGWDLADALWGGTKTMRDAGQTYMPKRALEEQADYDLRLAMATLYPAFIETLEALVGRAFSESIVVNEGASKWLVDEVLPDIDMQGRNLDVYAKDWFSEALRYGLGHTLIEAPSTVVTTLAEQKSSGVRPYTIKISPRRVLGWKEQNGVLTQVRIKFTDAQPDPDNPYKDREVEQIRVYEKKKVEVYEKTAQGKWILVNTLVNRFGFVPLVTAYTKRTGFMTAEPPLKELAYLNAKHWRMQSAVDGLVDTTSVPILALIGVNEGSDEIVIGAKHAVKLPLNGDMKYVEHTGAAVKTGRDALTDLKEEMRQAGAKMLTPQSAPSKTEMQSREENARENSKLGGMVKEFEDTLDQTLDMMAKTRSETTANAKVAMQPNLDPDFAPVESMKIVMEMRNQKLLSGEATFNEAKRRGLIDNELSYEDESARAAEEFDAYNPAPVSATPPAPTTEPDPAPVEDEDPSAPPIANQE